MAGTSYWRDYLKTIPEMNKYMLEHQIRVDCTFRVGSDPEKAQVFHSHKFVLARSSCVFDAMFYGSLPEEKEIRVTDVEPSVFALLLNYIYTYEVHLDNVKDAADLALAANKYMLKSLTSKCMAFMCHNVDVTNVLRCLEMTSLIENQQLKTACVKVLQEHTRMMIHSDCFKKIPESTLILFLDQDTLSCDEFELVRAAASWAEEQAKLRGMSADDDNIRVCLEENILPRLRFLSMTQTEFELGPGQRKWLTEEEKRFIRDQINGKKNADEPKNIICPPKNIICPNKIKRQKFVKPVDKNMLTINVDNICKRNIHSGITSFVHLEGNDMILLGVRIFSQVKTAILTNQYPDVFETYSRKTYKENIKIALYIPKRKDNEDACRCNNDLYVHGQQVFDYTYVNDAVPYNSVINVMFEHPIKLMKNYPYILCVYCSAGFYPTSGLSGDFKKLKTTSYKVEYSYMESSNVLIDAIIAQSTEDFAKTYEKLEL